MVVGISVETTINGEHTCGASQQAGQCKGHGLRWGGAGCTAASRPANRPRPASASGLLLTQLGHRQAQGHQGGGHVLDGFLDGRESQPKLLLRNEDGMSKPQHLWCA